MYEVALSQVMAVDLIMNKFCLLGFFSILSKAQNDPEVHATVCSLPLGIAVISLGRTQ